MKKRYNINKDRWKCASFMLSEVKKKVKIFDGNDIRISSRFAVGLIDKVVVTFDGIFHSFDELFRVEYPKTWFDAFKLEFFPSWLLKHFPVNMVVKKFTEVVPRLPKQYKSKILQEEETKKLEKKNPQ